jgi:UDP-glucose 4-epimerase
MIEEICRDYEQAYGLKTIALRYFNAAGADLDCEIGENHSPESHLIPLVIEAAMGIRPNITIFGTDFDTRDGTAIRDYIHVNDLATAHRQAIKYLLHNQKSQYLNLGTGNGLSVQEIIQAVERFSGKKISVVRKGKRTGEPPVLVAEATTAKKLLKWSPTYSDIDMIISSAWRWHTFLHQNFEALQARDQKIEHLFKNVSSLS